VPVDERLRREIGAVQAASGDEHLAGLTVDEVPVDVDVTGVQQLDLVVGDGGDYVSFAGRYLERPAPGLFIDPGPYGCLGSGPSYALAAKLAHADRQVVLLSGDGAFGFSGLEFDTLIRHQVPVVCVIGNNGIWATEKHPMQNVLGTSIAADLRPGTRYDKVVDALGGYGELVEQPGEIRPALERAFKAGVPACLNVICDPTAEYPRSSVLM